MKIFSKWFSRGQRGFTLIELLIVIAVLGILAGVTVPIVSRMLVSGNMAAANIEVSNVSTTATTSMAENHGAYPADSDVLVDGGFLADPPKALYTFNSDTGKITRVDSVVGGWSGLVFRLSAQSWEKGTDDGDDGTQDIP